MSTTAEQANVEKLPKDQISISQELSGPEDAVPHGSDGFGGRGLNMSWSTPRTLEDELWSEQDSDKNQVAGIFPSKKLESQDDDERVHKSEDEVGVTTLPQFEVEDKRGIEIEIVSSLAPETNDEPQSEGKVELDELKKEDGLRVREESEAEAHTDIEDEIDAQIAAALGNKADPHGDRELGTVDEASSEAQPRHPSDKFHRYYTKVEKAMDLCKYDLQHLLRNEEPISLKSVDFKLPIDLCKYTLDLLRAIRDSVGLKKTNRANLEEQPNRHATQDLNDLTQTQAALTDLVEKPLTMLFHYIDAWRLRVMDHEATAECGHILDPAIRTSEQVDMEAFSELSRQFKKLHTKYADVLVQLQSQNTEVTSPKARRSWDWQNAQRTCAACCQKFEKLAKYKKDDLASTDSGEDRSTSPSLAPSPPRSEAGEPEVPTSANIAVYMDEIMNFDEISGSDTFDSEQEKLLQQPPYESPEDIHKTSKGLPGNPFVTLRRTRRHFTARGLTPILDLETSWQLTDKGQDKKADNGRGVGGFPAYRVDDDRDSVENEVPIYRTSRSGREASSDEKDGDNENEDNNGRRAGGFPAYRVDDYRDSVDNGSTMDRPDRAGRRVPSGEQDAQSSSDKGEGKDEDEEEDKDRGDVANYAEAQSKYDLLADMYDNLTERYDRITTRYGASTKRYFDLTVRYEDITERHEELKGRLEKEREIHDQVTAVYVTNAIEVEWKQDLKRPPRNISPMESPRGTVFKYTYPSTPEAIVDSPPKSCEPPAEQKSDDDTEAPVSESAIPPPLKIETLNTGTSIPGQADKAEPQPEVPSSDEPVSPTTNISPEQRQTQSLPEFLQDQYESWTTVCDYGWSFLLPTPQQPILVPNTDDSTPIDVSHHLRQRTESTVPWQALFNILTHVILMFALQTWIACTRERNTWLYANNIKPTTLLHSYARGERSFWPGLHGGLLTGQAVYMLLLFLLLNSARVLELVRKVAEGFSTGNQESTRLVVLGIVVFMFARWE